MAAEIIAASPDLGVDLGQLLENGLNNSSSMSQVFPVIFLILLVGIAIDSLILSPLERRVLRGLGMLVTRRPRATAWGLLIGRRPGPADCEKADYEKGTSGS
jgi:hypothetical protein